MKFHALSKRKHILFLLFLGNVATIIGLLIFFSQWKHKTAQDLYFADILEHKTKTMDFEQLSSFFQDLAKAKGGDYAFQVLNHVNVGPNIDMHLLGHVVGDELYKQKGIAGIKDCTQDLRNACSHSVVIGAYSQLGEKALPQIAKACEEAPGGKGAYTMCFHGLGHGVLAYYGYDFPKMIQSCKKTGTPAHSNQEFPQCVGGAVMEIISGGGHDHETWARQRVKYLHPDDPLSLCNGQNMPEIARDMCYTYITPYLWEAAGAIHNIPTPEEIKRSFLLCNQVTEDHFRDTCFGAFGKEFIGFATARDIRQAGSISTPQATIIHNLCLLAPTSRAITDCVQNAVGSLFWGGENDPHSSMLLCHQFANSSYENDCYQAYISNVKTYIDPSKRSTDCTLLPKTYQASCKS
jgi:hypothetical protein